jgi:hypothetical protein
MADRFARAFGSFLRRIVDMGDGTYSERVVATPPNVLLTDHGGANARLRVDTGQTGFFTGKEFRTFREWTTATNGTFVIKIIVPVNTILFEFHIQNESGTIRAETLRTSPTVIEGGTFSEQLPVIATNSMTEKPQPPYVAQVSLTAGGT